MEFIRGLHNLKLNHRGCVATIGNFDGVHLGHQTILKQLTSKAQELGLYSTAIIFEPQPKEFFNLADTPARLTPLVRKLQLLEKTNVDRVCCLYFNDKLSEASAEAFVRTILVEGLGIRYLIVGDDFRFGNDRKGDTQALKNAGEKYGFIVTQADTYLVDQERVSSSRVREALAIADLELAAILLGRPYSISGKVTYGQQLGRQLKAATANIHLPSYHLPLTGVFAVTVEGIKGYPPLKGVANIGLRPTVIDTKPILEVHLFDFYQDIYGQRINVIFQKKLRDEKKFVDLTELQKAIQVDINNAKHYFAEHNNLLSLS